MRTRRVFTALLTLSAAFAVAAGGAPALSRAGARAGQGRTKAAPPRDSSRAQKRAASSKGKADAQAAAKDTAARPQVRVIDESGLKALLEESAKNGRRLLVNFWATWCTPCREEFPDLVKIDEEFGGLEDFEFVTVSLDDVSEIDRAVPEFIAEMRAARIPAYLLNAADPEAVIALVDQTWRGDLPATFLFGRKGEVLFKHTGRVKPDELRKAINASGGGATAGGGGRL